MASTPHGLVDELADGLANGAEGVIRGAAGALKSAGATVSNALDMPFRAAGKEGPHHVVGRAFDGAIDAVTDVTTDGAIEAARKGGKGVIGALDHPTEQFGVPPDLNLPKIPSPPKFTPPGMG